MNNEFIENQDTLDEIKNYFIEGIDTEDIIPLWHLFQKQSLLDAFITLFRGTQSDILIRLFILSEMVSKVDPPSWSMAELRHTFSYLTETAFETVVKRLRDGGLISYDRENNSYSVTPIGQKVQSSISLFLKSDEDEGIGMLTGLVYASEVTGTLGREELEHLLYRLNQLEQEMIEAIESASEHRIIKARKRLEAVWRYIEKGTEIIKKIAENSEMDRVSHRLGQQIGYAQSSLAKFASIFQRALNEIDKQRVHLGNSGVSTSDLNRYLMSLNIEELIAFMDGLRTTACPIFLLTDITADIAEYELIERERQKDEDWILPKLSESPAADDVFTDDLLQLQELYSDAASIEEDTFLHAIIPKRNFEESAYRLSMISLIGDKGEAAGSHMLNFVNLPLTALFTDEIEEVMRCGVKTISKGTLLKGNVKSFMKNEKEK